MASQAIPPHDRENMRVCAHCMGRGIFQGMTGRGNPAAATVAMGVTAVRPRNGNLTRTPKKGAPALPDDAARTIGQG